MVLVLKEYLNMQNNQCPNTTAIQPKINFDFNFRTF